MTDSDFWQEVDCVAMGRFSDSAIVDLPPSPATQPLQDSYLMSGAHLQSFLDIPRPFAAPHKRARSAPLESAKKKKRKSTDSRNTLRAPRVPSADALKVKKYPAEHKERFDAALCAAKIDFCVPPSVQSFVARPATKDMGKYWYVLWNAVFALLERDPLRLLPRATEHVALLCRAQNAVSALMHEATNNVTQHDDNRSSAEEPSTCGASNVGKENAAVSGGASAGESNATAQINNLSARPATLLDCAALFCAAARREVPHYHVDSDVVGALNDVLRSEQPKRESEDIAFASNTDNELLLLLHETCWAFIFGIVERLGDMFLTRACIERNALQLGLAQRAFWSECAEAGGAQIFSSSGSLQPLRAGACTNERAQNDKTLATHVPAVRDLLFHAFERLSQRNTIG